jgi:hypothetical protein
MGSITWNSPLVVSFGPEMTVQTLKGSFESIEGVYDAESSKNAPFYCVS